MKVKRLMTKLGFASLLLATVALAGCNTTIDRTCDEVRLYQLAMEGRRIETPEDLDELDELKEIPLPEASPRPPRPEGSPCLDLPPRVLVED